MEHLMKVRPKLKHNWMFIQTENGLFVTGEGTDFHIKGQSIARWIYALRPHMTGDYTLEQLLARLEPAQHEHVTRIIDMLLKRGVLKNELPEPSGILSEEVYNLFRPQIEYIDHFIDYPQEHFKKFRESSILLYGSGESSQALALSLLRNGLQEVSVYATDAPTSYLTTLEAEANTLRQAGCEAYITSASNVSLSTPGSLAGYDIVVYCADNGSLKDIFLLNEWCVREGRTFLAATPFAEEMMLGPLVRPGGKPCWLCAMMRLSEQSDDHVQANLWRNIVLGCAIVHQNALPSLPVARKIGNGLAFEIFKTLSACLPSEIERGVTFQNLENLESLHSQLIRHPLCPVCSHFTPDIAVSRLESVIEQARDQQQSTLETYQQHQHLFAPRMGVFARYGGEDVEQIPLKRSQVIGGGSINGKLDVTAFSLDTPFTARIQARKKAIGVYSRRMLDSRGLVMCSPREMAEQGQNIILPQELATWTGVLSLKADTCTAWLPAFSLGRKKLVHIPAAAVYPHSSLNKQGVFERTTAGAVVESTFNEALTRGTLSALGYEHLRELMLGYSTVLCIEPDSLDISDADLHFLVQSAGHFARPFALREIISDSLLVVIIAYTTDTSQQQVIGVGMELSGKAAVKAALEDLVGGLQLLASNSQLSETIGEDFISRFLTYDKPASSDWQASRLHRPETESAYFKDSIQQAGRDIIFAHTTSDDIWEEESLISGAVVLTRPAYK